MAGLFGGKKVVESDFDKINHENQMKAKFDEEVEERSLDTDLYK